MSDWLAQLTLCIFLAPKSYSIDDLLLRLGAPSCRNMHRMHIGIFVHSQEPIRLILSSLISSKRLIIGLSEYQLGNQKHGVSKPKLAWGTTELLETRFTESTITYCLELGSDGASKHWIGRRLITSLHESHPMYP